MRNDLRYAWRLWLRSPVLLAVAILTIALGIGANTAMFSLVNAVLLRPLPVRNPEQLTLLTSRVAGEGFTNSFSYPMYRDLQSRNDVFDGILARSGWGVDLSGDQGAEHVYGEIVSGNYFQVLGADAAAGRLLTPEDDVVRGGHPVAVITYSLWQRRFGGSPAVIGSQLVANGRSLQVIGVTHKGFFGPELAGRPEIFVPIAMTPVFRPEPKNRLENRRQQWLTLMARRKEGVSTQEARSRLNPVFRQILAEEERALPASAGPERRKQLLSQTLEVTSGAQGFGRMQRFMRTPLLMLLAVTGMVLLIACANLANLLLSRAAAREHEVAVRIAIGARRIHLLRHFLAESLIVSTLGGIAGLLCAGWLTVPLIRAMPEGHSLSEDFQIDGPVLLFTLLATVGTGILFGLAPAWSGFRRADRLRRPERGIGETGILSLRSVLLGGQVALSFLLVLGAGLFLRTVSNLQSIDTGFERQNILLASVSPSQVGYRGEREAQFYDALLQRMRSTPGVLAASFSNTAMLSGSSDRMGIVVEGQPASHESPHRAFFNTVTDGYFATLGMPLVAGRDFRPGERGEAAKVIVINETMARRYFGQPEAALGRHVGFSGPNARPDMEIIGVARDARYIDLREEARNFAFIPVGVGDSGEMILHLRAESPPHRLAGEVRAAVAALDRTLAVFHVKTLAAQIDESISDHRLMAMLTAFFGGLATALAAVGLYGVLAFTVARRTREIGIRMALGADRSDVVGMVLRHTALVIGCGLSVGLAGAAALSRFLESQLYGVKPLDPVTIAAAAAVLAVSAGLASWLPARRAVRVDPMVALRFE
ncbi:MAG: ABC transporter permease [Bryobacteraceae bacterium]|nr:ABC transporter permease [Bryobacteraceae bacterium]